MAGSNRLTKLLNTDSEKITRSGQDELRDLLSDILFNDSQDSEPENDSEFEDDDLGVCDVEEGDEETDCPLVSVPNFADAKVNVTGTNGDGEENMDVGAGICNGHLDHNHLLDRARQRSCNANGTGCTQIMKGIQNVLAPGDTRSGCITQFTPEEIVALQFSVMDMPKDAKDMMILGILGSCMRTGPQTESSKWKGQKYRERVRSSYTLLQRPVCKQAFLYLLGISQDKLTWLSKHYQREGLTPPSRKAGGSQNNPKCLTVGDTRHVVEFIKNFAEVNAVALPGRVPGFRQEDIRLLPSSYPKSRLLFRMYNALAAENGYRQICKSTFYNLWKELCPYIVVAKPMTDLCWRCQRNSTKIFHSGNLTLEQKQELVESHQRHLSQVEAERTFYRTMTTEAQAIAERHQLHQLQVTRPNSQAFTMHYSFDFAQQVHYPSNAAQPGPLYFLTPRKCGIFGVHCEGLSKQVNYLIDESVSCSKGSNAVISYLHHFFERYGLGEQHLNLHCDNCSGQNKNKWVLFYFAWRVMRGMHTSVTINFMPPGHTKFAPDWCFGLLKKKYRREHVSCLEDLVAVVDESTAVKKNNVPQLVGHEDGTVIVPVYNWQDFFKPAFKALPGIKTLGHFRFNVNNPGNVMYRQTLADEEQTAALAIPAKVPEMLDMPNVIPPPGLPLERQRYLFNQIREYVRADCQDTVCPPPQE